MKQERYIIDTCVIIWLLMGDKRALKFFDDFIYSDFVVSIDSLKEIFYKQSKGILKTNIKYEELLNDLSRNGIEIVTFGLDDLHTLYDLPYFEQHKDPNDRAIISKAIVSNRALVSADRLFTLYKKAGLRYVGV